MQPDGRFLKQAKSFWANVRTISERVGYTSRQTKQVKIPSVEEVRAAYQTLGLATRHIAANDGEQLTAYGDLLFGYFRYRADLLNDYVRPRLMDVERARDVFNDLFARFSPRREIPFNKQAGEKSERAFFTGIINMLIEANSQGLPCDYDPRVLTTVTRDGAPLRTFARRVDGAFTSTVNPIAIWEIKEYYYTTTFGSRVADGVYETLLDGMEIEELQEHENVTVMHYLLVDGFTTWWRDGRSYLCRMIDMLHMGYVDDVLFGYEVVERLPDIVAEWVEDARQHPERVSARGQNVDTP